MPYQVMKGLLGRKPILRAPAPHLMLSGGCFGWPAVLLDILTLPEIWGSSAESQSTIESLILIDQMSIAASVFTLVPGGPGDHHHLADSRSPRRRGAQVGGVDERVTDELVPCGLLGMSPRIPKANGPRCPFHVFTCPCLRYHSPKSFLRWDP